MTRDRLAQLLYQATYLVVRHGAPLPAVEEFLDLDTGNVLPNAAPRDWPTFWEETLATVMEDLLRREGYRIDEMEPAVFSRKNRSMRTIRDWMAARIMPLEPPPAPGGAGSAGPGGKRPARWRMICIGLLALAGGAALPALAGSRATLQRVPSTRPEAAHYRFEIEVLFKDHRNWAVEVPAAEAADPRRYDLRSGESPAEIVRIARVLPRGVRDREGFYTGALLLVNLDPARAYTLRLLMPQMDTAPLEVAVAPDTGRPGPGTGFVRFVDFVDRRVWGTLDLRTLEDDRNQIGIDFRLRAELPPARRRLLADLILVSLTADGMLSVRKAARQAHNVINLGLCLSWLRHYTLAAPGGRRQVHACGIQLLPVGFESDRSFRTVDYTLGPRLTFSLPLVDWPLLRWHDLVRMPRGFLPPVVSAGYRYVHRVRRGQSDPGDRHRLDGEINVVAPLLRPLDLLARWRWFYDMDHTMWDAHWELSWRWHIAPDSRSAVLLKLVHGALPPHFNNVDMAGLGFSLEL